MAAVTVGTTTFPSRKAAEAHFRDLFARWPLGVNVDGRDREDLAALVDMHPDAESKIGPGIERFTIGKDPSGRARAFLIERVDGTVADISYLKCLKGEAPVKQQVSAALRKAVSHQISEFRQRWFRMHPEVDGMFPCSMTGDLMKPEHLNVDHAFPMTFDALVLGFLDHRNLRLEDIVLRKASDGYGREVADTDIIAAFDAWHRERAVLRVVSAQMNMGMGKRGATQTNDQAPICASC